MEGGKKVYSMKEIKQRIKKAIVLKYGSLYLYAKEIGVSYQHVNQTLNNEQSIPAYMLDLIGAKKHEVIRTVTYAIDGGKNGKS